MKRWIYLCMVSLFIVFTPISAQISDQSIPIGFTIIEKAGYPIPSKTMPAFDVQQMLEEDDLFPYPFRYAKIFSVDYDIKKIGAYRIINGNDTLWHLRIESKGAYSLSLNFKEYELAEGAKLSIYNDSKTLYAGAYTSANCNKYKSFSVGDFTGDHLIIEYYEPENGDGKLVLGSVGHAYRDIFAADNLKNAMAADPANIDINCLEGKDWLLEKHAVCKISFNDGPYGYVCSGALINNTRNDGTPYFLTANHCIDTESEASTVKTYFLYEKITCGGTALILASLSGSSLMATDTLADFTLLLLDETPNTTYHHPYYTGWNIEDIASSKSVGIHHPRGDVKKISIDLDSAASYGGYVTWRGGNDSNTITTLPHTHWAVQFDYGITEPGSSGSPLFNQDGHIVGQLHGGSDMDLYGKISVSWNSGQGNERKLKPYLDPDHTGVTFLNGYYPAQSPNPEISSYIEKACLNATVQLYDKSVFVPTSWEWGFSPGTVNFVESTHLNSQNPKVQFTAAGSYTVTLKATNAQGSSTKSFENFISAGSDIEVGQLPRTVSDICYYTLDGYTLQALGASDYVWDLDTSGLGGFMGFEGTSDGSLTFSYSAENHTNGSFIVPIKIIGTHGACVDTTELELPINRQQNDAIADALMLTYGTNGPFSNACASKEQDEPLPPIGGCNTQSTWCEEGGVQNSVWFTFVGPLSGIISIEAPGFDDQVAVYEADSYQAILAGDYTIVAANDDYRLTDYSAVIEEATGIIPGKTYWVQVDGSGGGAEGDFTIILSDQCVGIEQEEKEMSSPMAEIFPNPFFDFLTFRITSIENFTDIEVLIYDQVGKEIATQKFQNISENEWVMNLSRLPTGIYFVKCVAGKKVEHQVLIKNK